MSAVIQAGLAEIPVAVFATWPAPSADPITRGHSILVYSAVLGPLTLITTTGRLVSRFRLQRNAGYDDYVHIAALPIIIALVVISNYANHSYYNKHSWDVEVGNIEIMAKLAWWMQILYVLAIGLVKQSLLLFYQRITSSGTSRPFHLFILGMRVFQGTTTMIWFFLTVFSCSPAPAYWTRFNEAFQSSEEYDKFSCKLAGPTPLITMSIISIVQDFICAALPFLIIHKLKVPQRQRIAIFIIFFFAFAACIIAVVRCRYIFQALVYTGDVAWYGYSIWETSIVEVLVGVIVSSLPAIKYIFRNYFDKSPSTDDSGLKNHRAGMASLPESGYIPARTIHTKTRTRSHFLSFSEQEALEIIALEAKLKPNEAEIAIELVEEPTPATELEQAFTADVADLPKRTPSCQEDILRKMGIIAPDQWQWDVSDLQERTPSRQERNLREAGIIKKDEWEDWDGKRDVQERTPSRQERDLREAGIIKRDEWQDWDGGRILGLGEAYFKSSLLQEGIVTPYPGKRVDQQDYFAGFEAIRAAAHKRPVRDTSLSQISP